MSRVSNRSNRQDEYTSPELASVSELDLALADPLTEAKFQGLKRLNAKKVAKLMAQIDLNQNELTDMKMEGKDNVRTRIIQGLKKKIVYRDTVLDYLKSEIIKLSAETEKPITPVDIDDVVMRRTVGGPKRFRPVERTKIETKITELEKKIKGIKIAAKEGPKDKHVSISAAEDFIHGPDADEKAEKIIRIKASEENAEYQQNYEANTKKIEYLNELLQNLRRRSSSQNVNGHRSSSGLISDDEYNKMRSHNDDISAQLERAYSELAVTEEEIIQCKSDILMANEHLQLEYDRIVSLTQKSTRQNETILKRMADIELEMDRIVSGTAGDALTTSAFRTRPINVNSAAGRCRKLKDGIKKCQEECEELGKDVEAANKLKDSIRAKNEEIRELKRSMHELARLQDKTNGDSEEGGVQA